MYWQPLIPSHYNEKTRDELVESIRSRRQSLGDQVLILGHHYQHDDVIQFADMTGDSFKLSRQAAEHVVRTGARYVIFAGVHFMAESADILTPDHVAVILPDLGAGCSMADMADIDDTYDAWSHLHKVLDGSDTRVIPICYMNSSAAIKAFCGEHGGAVCTSSNCEQIFKWALAGGTRPLEHGRHVKILFLPDQHLGRNTAAALGYHPESDLAVWDPRTSDGRGGLDNDIIRNATFILWKGHCSVHRLFRPEHVDQVRNLWPDVNVMVHPECEYEVAQKADYTGSTEAILQTVRNASPGSRWAIGTEFNMVNRLAREMATKDVEVRILSNCQCLCTTMFRIDLPHLNYVIDQLSTGTVVNQIKVKPRIAEQATLALERMLTITT